MNSLIFEMESDVLFTFKNETPSVDSSSSLAFSVIIFVMLFWWACIASFQAVLSIYCFLPLSDYYRLIKDYIL